MNGLSPMEEERWAQMEHCRDWLWPDHVCATGTLGDQLSAKWEAVALHGWTSSTWETSERAVSPVQQTVAERAPGPTTRTRPKLSDLAKTRSLMTTSLRISECSKASSTDEAACRTPPAADCTMPSHIASIATEVILVHVDVPDPSKRPQLPCVQKKIARATRAPKGAAQNCSRSR